MKKPAVLAVVALASRLLCWTTFAEGSCSGTTTADFLFQAERIRYRSVRDICYMDRQQPNWHIN